MNSDWTIELSERAKRALSKLDRTAAKRITRFLLERVRTAHDPRDLGKRLSGGMKDYWSYRVGDYRLICEIRDEVLVVMVIEIGHRREIYR